MFLRYWYFSKKHKRLVKNSQIQLVKKNNNITTPALNRFVSAYDIYKLAEEYGSPFYIVDENTLHAKVKELRKAYSKFKGSTKIAYSMKANFTPSIIKTFMKDGITFDLTSLGELYFIKRCNGNEKNIIYTSVTEEMEEYLEVLKNGVKRIVVSSFTGLINLAHAAKIANIRPLTMIRINPEVGVKAEVRASYKNGKFGVPLNSNTMDNATKMVRYILFNDALKFEGFHFHLGSQIVDFSCYVNAIDKLDSFIIRMKKEYPGFSINTLDIGGGTPVFYDDPVPSPEQMAENHITRLNDLFDIHGSYTLMVESGRFLVAESSMLISKIVNTKEFNDHKFVIVDAGYHILLDAALLKQEYPQEVISLPMIPSYNKSTAKNIHLAGRLCDTYDVFPLSKSTNLDNPDIGKYVAFYNVGAYSVVFNMPFHCQTKPSIIMKTAKGDFKLIRRGTTYEDLFLEEGGDML